MARLKIGEALLIARRRRDLTQSALARRAKVSRATVTAIEGHHVSPYGCTLRALDAALGGELSRLMGVAK